MHRQYSRLTFIALVAMAMVLSAGYAQTGTSARSTPSVWYPPLLDSFHVSVAGKATDGTLKFGVTLSYVGLMYPSYPQLRPHDSIPAVRVTLTLPDGVKIVRSKFGMAPPNNGRLYPRYPSKNFLWKSVNGHPTWIFYNLHPNPLAWWRFNVNMPDPSKPVCITAVATFPGVLHAPAQKTVPPDCYQPSTQ